jgi:hypothetical protein
MMSKRGLPDGLRSLTENAVQAFTREKPEHGFS